MAYWRLSREGYDVVRRQKVASKSGLLLRAFTHPLPSYPGHWPPVIELHLICFQMETPTLIFYL